MEIEIEFCRRCDASLQLGEQWCLHCGHPVPMPKPMPAPSPTPLPGLEPQPLRSRQRGRLPAELPDQDHSSQHRGPEDTEAESHGALGRPSPRRSLAVPRSWLRVLGVAAALLALALIPLWIHQSGARASDTNHDSEITAPNQERLLTLLEDFREAWNASDLDAAGAFFPLRHTSRGEQLGNRIEALGWRRADLPRVGKSSILRGDLAIEARTRFDLLPSTGPGGLGTTNHRLRERQIQLLWVWEKEPDSARADWHLLEVELPAPK